MTAEERAAKLMSIRNPAILYETIAAAIREAVAAEREECAQLAERHVMRYNGTTDCKSPPQFVPVRALLGEQDR